MRKRNKTFMITQKWINENVFIYELKFFSNGESLLKYCSREKDLRQFSPGDIVEESELKEKGNKLMNKCKTDDLMQTS